MRIIQEFVDSPLVQFLAAAIALSIVAGVTIYQYNETIAANERIRKKAAAKYRFIIDRINERSSKTDIQEAIKQGRAAGLDEGEIRNDIAAARGKM